MFDLPARNQPVHARGVRAALETAGADAKRRLDEDAAAHPDLVDWKPDGIVLTFESEPNHALSLEGLERHGGIHLLGLTERGGTQSARVFVPEKKLPTFLRVVDAYASSIVLTYIAEPANEDRLKATASTRPRTSGSGGPSTRRRTGKPSSNSWSPRCRCRSSAASSAIWERWCWRAAGIRS